MRIGWKYTGLIAAVLIFLGWPCQAVRAQYPWESLGGDYGVPPGGGAIRRWPMRWEFSASYVHFWPGPAKFPALATTGNLADDFPGGLGQASTVILYGERFDPSASPALRGTFTYWLIDPEVVSLETDFLLVEKRVTQRSFLSDASGFPVLSRPYFNPVTGLEVSEARAVPGLKQGSVSDRLESRLMTGEVNLRLHILGTDFEGLGLNVFGGGRWLQFSESYSNLDTTTDIGIIGESFQYSDRISTLNQFLGGQFGTELRYRAGCLSLGLQAKLAVGPNHQTIRIGGQTVRTDLATGDVLADNNQGFYAQPSNLGESSRHRITFMPEIAATAKVDVTDHVRLYVTYTCFSLLHTARPSDQIDRSINVQVLGSGVIAAPALPARVNGTSAFTSQMLSFGMEWRF